MFASAGAMSSSAKAPDAARFPLHPDNGGTHRVTASDSETFPDRVRKTLQARARGGLALFALLSLVATGCAVDASSPHPAGQNFAHDTPALPDGGAPNIEHDRPLPAPLAMRGRIALEPLGVYRHGVGFAESAAEVAAYDADSRRLFVVNVEHRRIDVLDISDPAEPQFAGELDVAGLGVPTSVAARPGLIAASVAAESKRETGKVVFLSPDGAALRVLDVGHEPDMLTFTPDGRWLLVANEGEPEDDYSFDPEGSISRIDVSGGVESLSQSDVVALDFRHFNGQRAALDSSIRIFGPGATVAQDLEPEYIAVSPDSNAAWAACQENNAIAVIDIAEARVTRLVGLGFKDHFLDGNGLDASDRDGRIDIRPWPVRGMYQPDGIASFRTGGRVHVVTVNDGKDRDYGGYSERCRVADLRLDPRRFPDAAMLQRPENLGRLRTTTATGDHDGDGLHEEIFSYGGRSFAIWTESLEPVFDSGDQFERITAAQHPEHFNSDHESHAFDDRSDDKGPEPEGLAIGDVGGATYAFIGLERMGGVLVYDISDPSAPVFENYVNTRDFAETPGPGSGGDLGPEGVLFINAADSPIDQPLLVVSHEVSGTTRIYRVLAVGSGRDRQRG